MQIAEIEDKFTKMGARVRVTHQETVPRFNVLTDRFGEFFDITGDVRKVQVLDVQPKDRHLLVMTRETGTRPGLPDDKSKFLCGHDERHWFVAGIPERASGVSSVVTAKQALQPDEVRVASRKAGVKKKNALKRHNKGSRRQGEWFFVPAPDVVVDEKMILKNEPLTRGRGSKPHKLEFAFRKGGTSVRVHSRHAPTGISPAVFARLPKETQKEHGWNTMVRDPELYAKGKVSHADHATIILDGWHRVYMNTEAQSRAMRQVAFLD